MKKSNIFITALLLAVCALGWFSAIKKDSDQASEYVTLIDQGDAWMEEGLYQRAIQAYSDAIEVQPAPETYGKVVDAYLARINEVTDEQLEDTLGDYEDFLCEAVEACPQEVRFARLLGEYYLENESYAKAYACLRTAVDNGITEDDIIYMMRQAQYAWSYRGGEYTLLHHSGEELYNFFRNEQWGLYSTEDGTILSARYSYISRANEDGVIVVTDEKDSRLLETEGIVLGIFDKKVLDAGVFADGLVAATCDGKTYGYYDEFANFVFGEYEKAGTFQDDRAAVCKGGVWFLIDTKGEKVSGDFVQIVLNPRGEYMVDSHMLAAEKKGTYGIYDEDGECVAQFAADQVDILTEDGLIAFCQGGKWGFVDLEGNVVIKPAYEMARSFSNGLAAVCKDGEWGFIDKNGAVAIGFQFADAMYFDELGICPVMLIEEKIVVIPPEDPNSDEPPTEEVEEEIRWQLLKLKIGIMEE